MTTTIIPLTNHNLLKDKNELEHKMTVKRSLLYFSLFPFFVATMAGCSKQEPNSTNQGSEKPKMPHQQKIQEPYQTS